MAMIIYYSFIVRVKMTSELSYLLVALCLASGNCFFQNRSQEISPPLATAMFV